MISYDLKCRPHSHAFEGWFGSRADYEKQLESGLLACPVCGSSEIEKMLSAPNVGAKSNQRAAMPPPRPEPVDAPGENSSGEAVMKAPELPPQMREAMAKIAEVQSKILEKSEWVGKHFAEEVRAQHYGESEERLVHGQASEEEARDLAEEGIDIMPVLFPVAPPGKRN